MHINNNSERLLILLYNIIYNNNNVFYCTISNIAGVYRYKLKINLNILKMSNLNNIFELQQNTIKIVILCWIYNFINI